METLKKMNKTANPRKNASVLSKLMFWYMNSLFSKGNKEKLQVSDMFSTLDSLSSVRMAERAKKEWQKEHDKKRITGKPPSILLAFIKANKKDIILQGLGQLFEETVNIVSAYLIGYLIDYFTVPQTTTRSEAMIYATVIALLVFINGIVHHTVAYQLECLGLQLRTAVSSMVYEKVTSLSQGSFGKVSAGNVINLISSDAHKLMMAFTFFNYFWIAPLKLVIVTVLLCTLLGVSALPGIALLLLFIPFQIRLGKLFAKLRKKNGALTDERVKITSELIKGMRAIKMYTWESPLGGIIRAARSKEISKLLLSQITRAINVSTFVCMPYLSTAAIFTTHYLRGQTFTATIVFSTLALLQLLKFTLGLFFPLAVQRMAEALSSSNRIETFLELDEQQTKNVTSRPLSAEDPKAYVNFCNVNCSWKDDKSALTLSNINFRVNHEKPLLMVIGPVGSGKTSILMSICGEVPVVDGSVEVNGRFSYASQKPWIFTGTVRQNILFGEEFDAQKYEKTVNACALKKDFKQLANGDLTMVGERGVCISGGQKARISLARAVYRNADVYVLDDPLSAVDAEVGKHIFERCVCDLLRDKITILTTHQIQFLKSASQILCIEEGKQMKLGSYEEIKHSDFDVQSILSENKDDDTSTVHPEEVYFNVRRRTSSVLSRQSDLEAEFFQPPQDKADESLNEKDVDEEKSKEGKIGFSLYLHYFRAGGGIVLTSLLFLACLVTQLSLTGVDWWIGVWSGAEEAKSKNLNMTSHKFKYYFQDNANDNLYMYLGWILATCILVFASITLFFWVTLNASKNLHNQMLDAILKAPMYFFDTTQTGRILNRFAKDTFFLDDELPWTFQDFIMYLLFTINAVIITCVNIPYMLIIVVLLAAMFLFLRSYFLVTARNVKRLEGISRSPMFAHLSATLEGLPTIRASNAVDVVIREFYDCQDHQSDGWYLFISISRWFGQRLDVLVASFAVLAVYAPLAVEHFTEIDSTLVGLSLVYDLQLCVLFQWCVRQSAQVESLMTSAERVFEYCELEPEPDVQTKDLIENSWPKGGKIEATNASFAYHATLPIVLKELTFQIHDGEKIGIVGRTGAGKSSIISAMFRTGKISGEILVDGVASKDVSLHDWRRNFSVIPQDPVLFSGSLRVNIDPFSEFEDSDLWDVLDQVQLKETIIDRNEGLLADVSEGGSNFSVGQRQLLCLARALLLRKKILFIDEATANVDNDTDAMIQETIRDKFKDCTVVTIAHRLNTIMDCDRIMVMDNGKMVQFDTPCNLFAEKDGMFLKLVKQTGEEEAANLQKIANEANETDFVDQKRSL